METPHVAIKGSSDELPIAHPGTVMELVSGSIYGHLEKTLPKKYSNLEHKKRALREQA